MARMIFKRLFALAMVMILCAGMMATPVMAWGDGGRDGGRHGDWHDGRDDDRDDDKDDEDDDHDGWNGGWGETRYEWYQVYVQGKLVASGKGAAGNVYYLGTHYEAGVTTNGHNLTWYINPHGGSSGNFSGIIDLRDYINVPEGYEVKEITVEESSIDGVNDPVSDMYDNAIITITIKTLYNEDTKETIVVPDPPEPPVTEPPATDTPAVLSEDALIEIPDEDVPLADVPQTGDVSFLWAAISGGSAGGLVLLNRKRKKEE